MNMDRWSGKVAVVTGASAGIGLHIAKTLLHHKMIVIGLARRKARMQEAMRNVHGRFHALECDLTKEDDIRKAFDFVRKNVGSVYVLVNNAACGNKGAMTTIESEKLVEILNLNVLGQVFCIRQVVKMMREDNHEGHIINIGSQLGHKVFHIDGFEMNLYSTTKFALRALSQTLQNELRDTQIRVTHMSPGVVKTDFFEAVGADPMFLQSSPALDPEDVADGVVYVLGTKPHVQIAELTIRHLHDYFR